MILNSIKYHNLDNDETWGMEMIPSILEERSVREVEEEDKELLVYLCQDLFVFFVYLSLENSSICINKKLYQTVIISV